MSECSPSYPRIAMCIQKVSYRIGLFIDNDYKSATKLHNSNETDLRRWEKNAKIELKCKNNLHRQSKIVLLRRISPIHAIICYVVFPLTSSYRLKVFLMEHLENRGIERTLYGHQCIYGEIVGASHPFADFCLALAQQFSQILLP